MRTKLIVRKESSTPSFFKNKVVGIIIVSLIIIGVLGILLFYGKPFVGKAINYQLEDINSSGAAGIPSNASSTLDADTTFYLFVIVNLGSQDAIVFSFNFTYDPSKMELVGIINSTNMSTSPNSSIPLPNVFIMTNTSSSGSLTEVQVKGAVLPPKSLRDYTSVQYGDLVPLMVLEMKSKSSLGRTSVDFTDFQVLNASGSNIVTKILNATFEIIKHEICTNRIDDDENGLIDCADPACIGRMGSGGICQSNEIICNDSFDNDADGEIDCADSDCFDRLCAPESYCENTWMKDNYVGVKAYETECTADRNHNYIEDNSDGYSCAKGNGGYSDSVGNYVQSWITGTDNSTGQMFGSANPKRDYCTDYNTALNYYYCLPDLVNFSSVLKNCSDLNTLDKTYYCNSTYQFCQACQRNCSVVGTGLTKQCGDDGCGGSCGTCSAGTTCNASWQCSTPRLCNDLDQTYSPNKEESPVLNENSFRINSSVIISTLGTVSYSDLCGGDLFDDGGKSKVQEYYCQNSTTYGHIEQDCPFGTHCFDGACTASLNADEDGDGVLDNADRCPSVGKTGKVYLVGANVGCWYGDQDGNGCLVSKEFLSLQYYYLNQDNPKTVACTNSQNTRCLTSVGFLSLQYYYLNQDNPKTVVCK